MARQLTDKQISQLLGLTTPQQATDIRRKILECLEIARVKFPLDLDERPYKTPSVKFDLRGRVAGEAWAEDIRLNVDLLHKFYDEMLNVVLPHEIAHCVTIQKYGWEVRNHGREWAQVMRAYGLPPRRTHDMPVKLARKHPRPHKYGCPKCSMEFKLTNGMHNKILAGSKRYCPRCKAQVIYLGSDDV